jgi:uncharacterized protein (TIGR00369 family)
MPMIQGPDFKELPNSHEHNCFGCSPVNSSGLQMKFFTDDVQVISEVSVPEHLCGWSNIVHGGVLTTILDEIMSWTALYFLKRITMTRSMRIEFMKPAFIQSPLRVQGRVLEKSGKRDAVVQGTLFNSDEDICARSTANFVVFSPAVARRLKIADDKSLRWFEEVFGIK